MRNRSTYIYFPITVIALLFLFSFAPNNFYSAGKYYIKKYLTTDTQRTWAIGIYSGDSPLDLADPEHIVNPVLTGDDVSDVDAEFVADPFIVHDSEKYYMFFEVWNNETNTSDISCAESLDGNTWQYKQIILDEDFNLAFPHVFKWDNEYYLVPSRSHDYSVRIYKSSNFPTQWEYLGNLINGYRFSDPSIFRHNNKWWMFVSTPDDDVLNLYYSSDLLSGWTAHPKNPVVKARKDIARPAGRVFEYEGNIYRLAQDASHSYGEKVFAFKITTLTEETYVEEMASRSPLLQESGEGWNARGMHHMDLYRLGNKWMAVVDGRH